MAECHDLLVTFHEEIRLGSEKKESLRVSRNAVRTKIKNYFRTEKNLTAPLFYGQGSYMMNTTVNPLDGEYDLDDGVYLQHLMNTPQDEWPSVQTVHNWVVSATDGHTSTPPIDKATCVRVVYKGSYRLDLPIYIKRENEDPLLAHKTKGWIVSDPKALTKWFREQVTDKGDQLRKIVQYLKAWKDYQEGETRLPSGVILTILAVNHFEGYADRDDSALVATAKAIHEALSDNFSVCKPVVPGEDLLENWSETRRDNFLTKLNSLVQKGTKALETDDRQSAAKKWREIFGERFPEPDPEDDPETDKNAKFTKAPAVLGNHGRSA